MQPSTRSSGARVSRIQSSIGVPRPSTSLHQAFRSSGPSRDDLLVVDLAQMDLDGLGDELGDRRPAAAVLVVVVLRRRGRVGADHARDTGP